MVTLMSVRKTVRPARKYPVPKFKPARLSSEVAKFRGHNVRKPKSRNK
jgi:hypothetical protein